MIGKSGKHRDRGGRHSHRFLSVEGQRKLDDLRLRRGQVPDTVTPVTSTPMTTATTTVVPSINTSATIILPLAGRNFVVDAGHGGKDPGTIHGSIHEADLTLIIAHGLRNKLVDMGANVTMTRITDVFVDLDDRVAISNNINPDAFVSVHINSISKDHIHGIETYYYTSRSSSLAAHVHRHLVAELGAEDRGVRTAGFRVIKNASVPAILAEVGYLTNSSERGNLTDSSYRDKIAQAIANGVRDYVTNPNYKGPLPVAKPKVKKPKKEMAPKKKVKRQKRRRK